MVSKSAAGILSIDEVQVLAGTDREFKHLVSKVIVSRAFCSLSIFAMAIWGAQNSGLFDKVKNSFAKTNERFVSKVPRVFLRGNNPDVLIIGSSLIQVPSVRCDDEMRSGQTRYDPAYYNHIFQYDKADYLQSLLQTRLGAPVTLLNGAVAATTLADQYLLFKKFIDHGGNCKVAIVCLSARELHDNYHPIPEKTQVYELLGNPLSMQALRKRGLTDCLTMTWQQMNPLFANRLQLQRAAVKFEEKAAHIKNDSAQDQAPNFVQPPNILRDIDMWKTTYNPVDWKLYTAQVGYLEKILQLAETKSIPVVIVDMPLPRQNTKLIPAELKARISADLNHLTSIYDARLVRPGLEQQYPLSDFEDGGHMVPSGGRKLFQRISKCVAETPALRDRLIGTARQTNL